MIDCPDDFLDLLSDMIEEGKKIEEEENNISEEQKIKERKYVVLFDPMDGSIKEFKSPADLARFFGGKIHDFYHVISRKRKSAKTYKGFHLRWKWERKNDE